MRHRVKVVADAHSALCARLERRRSAAAEGVQHDVTRAAVARDEGVCERSREHRQVAAHRMEGMAPEALLELPFRLDTQPWELQAKADLELTGGDALRCGHGRAADLVLAARRRTDAGRAARIARPFERSSRPRVLGLRAHRAPASAGGQSMEQSKGPSAGGCGATPSMAHAKTKAMPSTSHCERTGSPRSGHP